MLCVESVFFVFQISHWQVQPKSFLKFLSLIWPAVDQTPQTPTPKNKARQVLLHVLLLLLLFLFIAFPVAVWWVHRRAARRTADRGTLAPRTPFRPVSIPSPVYLRLTRSEFLSTTSRASHAILNMANALTATPIRTQRPRQKWIVLAVLSVVLMLVGLVLS